LSGLNFAKKEPAPKGGFSSAGEKPDKTTMVKSGPYKAPKHTLLRRQNG